MEDLGGMNNTTPKSTPSQETIGVPYCSIKLLRLGKRKAILVILENGRLMKI